MTASALFPVSRADWEAGRPAAFKPATAEDWALALRDVWWRLTSGALYKVMTKGDDGLDNAVAPFIPNTNQLHFVRHVAPRTVCLKARQLGMTTLIQIMWLDHALFVPDQRCLTIAHKLDDAKRIFRDKIRFAYDNLPDPLRERFPLKSDSASEMLFAHNNSNISVSTSARSGTFHRLHISEMGKIAATAPGKAVEIVTGSLPAVPKTGWALIESTAEGTDGEFYKIAKGAQDRWEVGQAESPGTWAFRFYPWFAEPGYALSPDPRAYPISAEMHEYFDSIEAEAGVTITMPQRTWYVWKRDHEFAGDPEKMTREMPSTPSECWQTSAAGTFFGPQIARVRAEGRFTRVPIVSNVPVNTFWDIGASDGTAVWLHQQVGFTHRFVGFIEAWSEPYAYFIRALEDRGVVWGRHYLPHDAAQHRQQAHTVASPMTMLRQLRPTWDWRLVPVTADLQHGIVLTREAFAACWFDNTDDSGVPLGFDHLANYRKRWSATIGAFTDQPVKFDGHSEAADAFRQFAQGYEDTNVSAASRPRRPINRPTGMTA